MKRWVLGKHRRRTRRTPWHAILERLEVRTLLAAPVVVPIADQTAAVNATVFDSGPTLSVSSVDGDGDSINLTASLANGAVLPPWLTFTPGPFGSGTGTFALVAPGATGSIDVKVTVTDENGDTGSDVFTLTATDATLAANVQIANQTIGVHAPFSLPVPADAFTNDTDLATLSATLDNGDTLPAWLTFTPGPAASTPTGTFSGTPLDADIGTINVKLTATDDKGAAAFQIFAITVPLNHTPEFIKGSDQAPTFDLFPRSYFDADWATGILEGPPEEYGQTLSFEITTDNDALFAVLPQITIDDDGTRAANGTLKGTLTYTIAGSVTGTANVTVRLKDNGGGADTSDPQTFVIAVTTSTDSGVTVNPIPNQMVGVHTPFLLSAAGVFSGGGEDLTLSATLANGNPLPAWLTFTPGPAGLPPTGLFSGIPVDVDIGSIDVMLTATDPNGLITTDTFTITVPFNHTPQFTKGLDQSVNEDIGAVTVGGWATNLVKGPPEENGQVLDFIVTTNNDALFSVLPAIAADGTLTFTPAADAVGLATVTVRVHDNGGSASGGNDTSDPQTFTITVNSVSDIVADALTTTEDTAITANLITGTNGASADNFEGTPVLTSVTQGTNGTVSFLADGTVTYTPNPDFNGTDSFTYTVTSGGNTETGTVTVTITAASDIVADALTTTEDTAITANLITGTNGASADNFEGTPVLTSVTQGTNGTVSFLADGTVTYTPNPDFNGTDSFTYTVTSGGVTETVSVTVTVADVNDAPIFTINPDPDIANPKVLLTAGPQTFVDWASVSPGPADEAGQAVNFIVTTDKPGLFRVLPAISPTGTLTFTPANGFGGTATITVKLKDDGGTANGGDDTSDEQTFTITTYLADVTYTAVGSKKLKAVVVNGLLVVQTGGITNSGYLPEFIETLTLNGGSGDDLINLSGLDPALYPNLRSIVINGGGGKDAVTFNALSTDPFANFVNLTINGDAGNDLINLTDLPTTLFPAITTLVLNGGAGNDTIFGSDLDDTITGGAGNDSLNGLDGTDRLAETANVSFKLTDTKLTGLGTDKLASIEQAELTGGTRNNKLDASGFTGAVTLSGGAGNDTLLGGSCDDALIGGDGKDSLVGGTGADTLIGGLGNDTLKGGTGDDLLIGGLGSDSLDGEAGSDFGLGGEGAAGAPRFGNGVADAGDVLTSLETIDEMFATLFDFE